MVEINLTDQQFLILMGLVIVVVVVAVLIKWYLKKRKKKQQAVTNALAGIPQKDVVQELKDSKPVLTQDDLKKFLDDQVKFNENMVKAFTELYKPPIRTKLMEMEYFKQLQDNLNALIQDKFLELGEVTEANYKKILDLIQPFLRKRFERTLDRIRKIDTTEKNKKEKKRKQKKHA